MPLTIAGFGDSITQTTSNDGSYMLLLGNYLAEAPILDDNGISANPTSSILTRLDTWITDGNSADFVIILAGTVDPFSLAYNQATTVANIDAMLDLVIAAGMSPILAAPPAVQSPCGGSINPTCATIANDLMNLSGALATVASSLSVPFVDLHDAFVTHPDFGEVPGSALSLFRLDGLHPKLTTGDDLIAKEIAAVIPEPSSTLLLAYGLIVLALRRRRRH